MMSKHRYRPIRTRSTGAQMPLFTCGLTTVDTLILRYAEQARQEARNLTAD